uniref:Uncharacterized protein n=1 Tax=viral metagenome TaxID=1070528 RepID=A0A6M3J5E3_9ZZZZ
MSTRTLVPNGAGDSTQLVPSAGANWQCVDAIGTDYVWHELEASQNTTWKDLYALEASNIASAVINSVTVYFRCKHFGLSSGYALSYIKTHSTVYQGSAQAITTSYVTYGVIYTTNPFTGVAWTVAEIDDLQSGVALNSITGGSAGDIYCQYAYVVVDFTMTVSASCSLGFSATSSRALALTKTSEPPLSFETYPSVENNQGYFLCIASRASASIKTSSSTGATWTDCAKDADGTFLASHFAQYLNRLCSLNFEHTGFGYSEVNDIYSNWTKKASFPNLPFKFTDMFVARDAGDDPVLYFLTPVGMYYLDVFSNFEFGQTELTWEEDATAGKKGLYWKGDIYVAMGKGINQIHGGVVTAIGPDTDDGLPEEFQGTITDMIGVGFWLVIAVDGGNTTKKSCILRRYINGKHWHVVHTGSAADTAITALFWDAGTLYFGEGTNVKSLPMPNVTENVAKNSTYTYRSSGDLIYPKFHSQFEAMPKVAHKVRAVTKDCNATEYITISYRIDEDTAWTVLGSFITSPRPTALGFPVSGDKVGLAFENIQFKASFARGSTTTTSPKMVSLILEYRVIPPVLWGFNMKVNAMSQGNQRGQDIIDALRTAIETGTLLSFYPGGDPSGTEYFVEVVGVPGQEGTTEFGNEGIYDLSVQEVID